MYRYVILTLCLICLIFAAGTADTGRAGDLGIVVNVNEYVTLRQEPRRKAAEMDRIPLGETVVYLGLTDGEFSCVAYHGMTGYTLSEYLQKQPREKGNALTPDAGLTIRLNMYLTNFSDLNFGGNGAFFLGSCLEREMVDFAVDVLFSRQKEDGEWGKYNARVNGQSVPAMVERFFGISTVNVRDTRYGFSDGYYYSEETGDRSTGGFAIVDLVEIMENGLYRIQFTTYGEGKVWKPEGVCALSPARAAAMYPKTMYYKGEAVINMNGAPEDELKWTMVSWIVKRWE